MPASGNRETRKLSELHEWDKNPRSIKEVDFNRLKKQIEKLGQYKPLLITPDGEVIGGNMRLKAYKALGVDEVWVSVVKPKDENEKLEYALSDNDRAGFYDTDLLANMMNDFKIEWSDFAIDFGTPVTLKDILGDEAFTDFPEKDLTDGLETEHDCPKCGYKW